MFSEIVVSTQSYPHVSIHGIQGGTGPPLLLLHGFPQSHHIWHRVSPNLVDSFTIIALDLRGYGESSKPSGSTSQYSKSTMARDCALVMESLGFSSYYVCAHDRGARVAHKLAVDYPERVKRLILLDICPTLAMYESTNFEFAKNYFHWFFLIQKAPFPETVIGSNPGKWVELFMGGRYAGLGVFKKENLEYYISVLKKQEAVHAMCEDYRASAGIDMEEAREDLAQARRIKCPLMVLWGKFGVIEKCFDAVQEWKKVVDPTVDVRGHSLDCGHYIPEEVPDAIVECIREFFL